ncbi:MAG TPA: hypothetical protein VK718_01780 [Ferruginibacter sp.]|jgi:hypothetical protein|nr:hypothetical protein [Ferruginibacter sp.]
MAKLTTNQAELIGKSKTKYIFPDIYAIGSEYPDESGIYAFTKRTKLASGGYSHHVIYIGLTESFKTRFSNHHKEKEILKEGANAVCLMPVKKATDRETFEKDLIAGLKPCCNEVHV